MSNTIMHAQEIDSEYESHTLTVSMREGGKNVHRKCVQLTPN